MRFFHKRGMFTYKILACILLTIVLISVCLFDVNAQKYNMTYLYGAGDYLQMVNNTNGALNEVSPSYFDIDEEGNLKLNPIDANLVKKMHNQGIKVVPFFSNHWDRTLGRKAFANKNKIVIDIVNAVINNDLDGVNVDIENLNESDRENYVEIAKLFREKLPEDKCLVISVAANPYDYKTGWHASYDYENLSKYADYLMVMAYDEHYEGGEPGAVASFNFVNDSVSYAVSKADRSKIVLGLPLYGRYWKENVLYGGWAVSLEKVNELAKMYESKVTYDKQSESVKAVITIKASDTKPKIYGKTLAQGTYIFWYENEDSLRAKLELINTYNIKGVGTWRLGMEEKSIWDIFKEVLSDKVRVFKDVPSNHWASLAIKFLSDKAWANGKADTIFAPEDNLSRAEIAAIVCRMLDINGEEVTNQNTYKDVKNHWGEKYIEKMSDLGILNGYEDGSFKPDNSITRAEVCKIINKTIELNEFKRKCDKTFEGNGYTVYVDININGTEWYKDYIIDLSKKKILNGYTDGTFRPQGFITRAEMAQMIYNLWN